MNKVANIKVEILKNGVKFFPKNMFTNIPNINEYKIKSIKSKPTILKNKIVLDTEKEKNVLPSEILLNIDGKKSITKLRYNEQSNIEIKYEDKKIILCDKKNNKKVEANLVKKYEFLEEKVPNSINKNAKIKDYVDIVGNDRISILFFEGCYNWNIGKPCKFCDLHPKKIDEKVIKPSLNELYKYKNIDDWWNDKKENYFKGINYSLKKIVDKNELKHKHLFFMAGNLESSEKVWKIAEETISYISNEFDMSQFDSYLNIAPHPNIEILKKVKELGIKQVQYNLEIANKEIFEYTCPGKCDYDEFCNKLNEAVEIFGKGNVRSNFVLGLQNMDELINEIEKFAQKGIVADYSVFQPKRNTPYQNKETPDFDKVIDFTIRLVNIYKKYNFKPIFCPLSSRSSIVNEVYEY